VVANASKLPGLTKALPGFKGELLAVVYWGSANEGHVQVRGNHRPPPDCAKVLSKALGD
jgi:hypothetical protein